MVDMSRLRHKNDEELSTGAHQNVPQMADMLQSGDAHDEGRRASTGSGDVGVTLTHSQVLRLLPVHEGDPLDIDDPELALRDDESEGWWVDEEEGDQGIEPAMDVDGSLDYDLDQHGHDLEDIRADSDNLFKFNVDDSEYDFYE
jgi:hypothetical protein